MPHFALICPPFYSHLRVFEALGAELIARGHRATVIDCDPALLRPDSGVAAHPVTDEVESHSILSRASRPNGPLGILRTVADSSRRTDRLCAAGPEILSAIGADAIVGDQTEPAAGLLAAYLGRPHVSVACGLPINAAPGVPPPFVGWRFDASPKGLEWIAGGERIVRLLLTRQRRTIESWSRRFGLPLRSNLEDCLSSSTQIAQISRAFDFPRPAASPFHAVGRIRMQRSEQQLPYEPDPARPFVFASMGTLQGGRLRLFQSIAQACRRADAQLLVAHCGLLDPREAASIGADHVTDFAPQQAVLARADLCITHAGLNTVLDAIAAELPLLALPIAFDQPGVAARIVHHGLGERLPHRRASPARLQRLIAKLLAKPGYRPRISRQGEALRVAGGTEAAVDLIEAAATPSAARSSGR